MFISYECGWVHLLPAFNPDIGIQARSGDNGRGIGFIDSQSQTVFPMFTDLVLFIPRGQHTHSRSDTQPGVDFLLASACLNTRINSAAGESVSVAASAGAKGNTSFTFVFNIAHTTGVAEAPVFKALVAIGSDMKTVGFELSLREIDLL